MMMMRHTTCACREAFISASSRLVTNRRNHDGSVANERVSKASTSVLGEPFGSSSSASKTITLGVVGGASSSKGTEKSVSKTSSASVKEITFVFCSCLSTCARKPGSLSHSIAHSERRMSQGPCSEGLS